MHEEENEHSLVEDDDLSEEFVTWAVTTVKVMRELTDALSATPRRNDSQVVKIYDLTHNMKGMGSSFGYALLTAIGTSLCGYLKLFETDAAVSKRVIEAHTRAQEVVVENRIKGDGGEKGKALTARLIAIIVEESSPS